MALQGTMEGLAATFSRYVGRPILDQTGSLMSVLSVVFRSSLSRRNPSKQLSHFVEREWVEPPAIQ